MVANQDKLANGIPALYSPCTQETQQLWLQYLGSLIDNGHVKRLQAEQSVLEESVATVPTNIWQRPNRSCTAQTVGAGFQYIFYQIRTVSRFTCQLAAIRIKSTAGLMPTSIFANLIHGLGGIRQQQNLFALPIKIPDHGTQGTRGFPGARRSHLQEIIAGSLCLQSDAREIIGSFSDARIQCRVKLRKTLPQQQIAPPRGSGKKAVKPLYMLRKEVSI